MVLIVTILWMIVFLFIVMPIMIVSGVLNAGPIIAVLVIGFGIAFIIDIILMAVL